MGLIAVYVVPFSTLEHRSLLPDADRWTNQYSLTSWNTIYIDKRKTNDGFYLWGVYQNMLAEKKWSYDAIDRLEQCNVDYAILLVCEIVGPISLDRLHAVVKVTLLLDDLGIVIAKLA